MNKNYNDVGGLHISHIVESNSFQITWPSTNIMTLTIIIFAVFCWCHRSHLVGLPVIWVAITVERLITCQIYAHHSLLTVFLTQLNDVHGPACTFGRGLVLLCSLFLSAQTNTHTHDHAWVLQRLQWDEVVVKWWSRLATSQVESAADAHGLTEWMEQLLTLVFTIVVFKLFKSHWKWFIFQIFTDF